MGALSNHSKQRHTMVNTSRLTKLIAIFLLYWNFAVVQAEAKTMTRVSRVIKLLPLCWSALLCFTIFLSYAIAVSLDHVYPILPSISKTAAFQPQASIFRFLLSFVAFFWCCYDLPSISSTWLALEAGIGQIGRRNCRRKTCCVKQSFRGLWRCLHRGSCWCGQLSCRK